MGKSILFVDDERPILRSLQRSLRGSGFEILIAASGSEALHILSQYKVDLIVSDVRMPNMNGHQLLQQIQQLYPATVRLLLSGQADDQEIAEAIRDGSCSRYILKPWNGKELLHIIHQQLGVSE